MLNEAPSSTDKIQNHENHCPGTINQNKLLPGKGGGSRDLGTTGSSTTVARS